MQISQPVTITIPYAAPASSASASAYWYNSLTGTISQGGLTDIEHIQISSTLYAMRFKTTHFTPFYLLLRRNAPVTKCKVSYGKTPGAGQDSIQLSGVIDVTSNDLTGAGDINIEIRSLTDNLRIYSESINFNPNNIYKGKYSYKRDFKKNGSGGIALFQLDLNKHSFGLQIRNIDLAGLSYPMSVEIKIGDYVGVGQVESYPTK